MVVGEAVFWTLMDGLLAVGTPIEKQLETLQFHALDPRLSAAQRGAAYHRIWKLVYDNALVYNYCLLGQVWLHNKKLLNADLPPLGVVSFGADWRYAYKVK